MKELSKHSHFIISLDFELMWGVRDKHTMRSYGENILGVRQAIPKILQVFQQNNIRATWATVGLLLHRNKKEMLQYLPPIQPLYIDKNLTPYHYIQSIGSDEAADPYHFGYDLAKKILEVPGMELGSHTYSHFYCLEKGQTQQAFHADLSAFNAVANDNFNVKPVSLVFPRNQYHPDYLETCRELGYKVFRGNESSAIYKASADADTSTLQRAMRLMDSYINLSGANAFVPSSESGLLNVPSSRFLRPYTKKLSFIEGMRIHRIKRAMLAAAKKRQSFHLWWHPHNFGKNLNENLHNLQDIIRYYLVLKDKYGMLSANMGDFVAWNDSV